MPSRQTAASAATLLHAPPRGHVTGQLALRAIDLIAVLREQEADRFSLARLEALKAEACFNPSGNARGAAFQLAIVLGFLEQQADQKGLVDAMSALRQVLDFVGSGEPFAGYFYAS